MKNTTPAVAPLSATELDKLEAIAKEAARNQQYKTADDLRALIAQARTAIASPAQDSAAPASVTRHHDSVSEVITSRYKLCDCDKASAAPRQARAVVPTVYARRFDLDGTMPGSTVIASKIADEDWNVPLYTAPVAASPEPATAAVPTDECLLCAKNGGHCWRHKNSAQPVEQPAEDAREWVVFGGKRMGRTHLAELERDAARYRWLRNNCNKDFDPAENVQMVVLRRHATTLPKRYSDAEDAPFRVEISGALDEAVDAAMQASKGATDGAVEGKS